MAKRREKVKIRIRNYWVFALVLVIVLVGVFICYDPFNWFTPKATADISIHFLELGNKNAGDCIYIKCGENDILVDAGSKRTSASTIANYLKNYVTDNKLEYVIATHADQDHISAFAGSSNVQGIFDRYDTDIIIDFPKTNKNTQILQDYYAKRDAEVQKGAKHYSALECYNNENGAQRVWSISDGIQLEILYNYYYENYSADENNYSVCFIINNGDQHYLFTGDLEESGETKLVENNNLPRCELFKAGHHGSKTSSNTVLLDVIRPKYSVVCCCAGSDEYTSTPSNQFPTQAYIDRISKYTSNVYVTTVVDGNSYTSMNGNVVFKVDKGNITVTGSNNTTPLKDTQWFKENRTCPQEWKSAA